MFLVMLVFERNNCHQIRLWHSAWDAHRPNKHKLGLNFCCGSMESTKKNRHLISNLISKNTYRWIVRGFSAWNSSLISSQKRKPAWFFWGILFLILVTCFFLKRYLCYLPLIFANCIPSIPGIPVEDKHHIPHMFFRKITPCFCHIAWRTISIAVLSITHILARVQQ